MNLPIVFLESVNVHYDFDKIFVDDLDVTEAIRSEDVTKNVSLVSSFPYVRKKTCRITKGSCRKRQYRHGW